MYYIYCVLYFDETSTTRVQRASLARVLAGNQREMLFLFLTCIRVANPKLKCDENSWPESRQATSSSPQLTFVCSIREGETRERRERRETRDSERDTFARTHIIHTVERVKERRCVVACFVRVKERVKEIDAFFFPCDGRTYPSNEREELYNKKR